LRNKSVGGRRADNQWCGNEKIYDRWLAGWLDVASIKVGHGNGWRAESSLTHPGVDVRMVFIILN